MKGIESSPMVLLDLEIDRQEELLSRIPVRTRPRPCKQNQSNPKYRDYQSKPKTRGKRKRKIIPWRSEDGAVRKRRQRKSMQLPCKERDSSTPRFESYQTRILTPPHSSPSFSALLADQRRIENASAESLK